MPPTVTTQARHGCLWYVGVSLLAALGLAVLGIAALIIAIHNEHSQQFILVSATDQTYLEAETTNHGEGFLDGYDWLEVYYVRSSWLWNERVQVYNIPHASARDIVFRRQTRPDGQLQIEIASNGAVLATFTPPASFPEK